MRSFEPCRLASGEWESKTECEVGCCEKRTKQNYAKHTHDIGSANEPETKHFYDIRTGSVASAEPAKRNSKGN